MIRHSAKFLLSALCVCMWAVSAGADFGTNYARVSLDVRGDIGGLEFDNEWIVSIGSTKPGDIFVPTFPDSNRFGIDALTSYDHYFVFSADVDFMIGSEVYRAQDLVRYDFLNDTYAMFWDASTSGVPQGVNVDAVCIYPGEAGFYFSIDVTDTLPGITNIHDHDILRFNAGTFSVAVTGQTTLKLPPDTDIDALHYDGTNFYYSLDTTVALGNYTGRHNDVWYYNSSSAAIGLLEGFPVEDRCDITSIDEPRDSDGDWLTDFEEYTGIDEAASVFPGSIVPMGPNGYVSDPFDPDSDGDGMSDGEEAACGTNPTNDTEYLHITQIVRSGGDDIITWQSIPGKTYDLQGSGGFSFGNDHGDNVASGGLLTSFTNATGSDLHLYRIRLEPYP